ncbi:MAG TPA: ABC transporter permease [Candidatus Angelobacter sp.]|nr:ABC transporter permease [Candidatus Angelobacter sp.]
MREWLAKLSGLLVHRRDLEEDLHEEITAHIDCETQENIERGMTPDAAQAAARRHFGNPTLTTERAQEAWMFSGWETFWQEVRQTLRGIRRSPGFSLIVILTLALGIGANTAIFSVVYPVLLKPLPFPAGDRLVRLGESSEKAHGFSVSWLNYQHWRQDNRSFEDMAAYEQMHMTLTGREDPQLIRAAAVAPSLFSLVGMQPIVGRLLDARDDQLGTPPVLVVSENFWTTKLGGKASILGTTLALDGTLFQVVGVASSDPGFFLKPADVYLSIARLHSREVNRGQHGSIRVLGRLKPGATLMSAHSDLDAIMRRLAEVDPGPENDHRADLLPLKEFWRAEIRPTLLLLFAAVGLVLAIACANVASLLLARSTARTREIAIRTAIGAGRLRLIRSMLVESLMLSVLGGLAGLLVAYGCLRTLLNLAQPAIPHLTETTLHPQVLAFTGGIAILTGLMLSLAPILLTRRLSLVAALKENTQSATSSRAGRAFRSALVAGEIALTLLLVFTSGLLLSSLIAAQTRPPGFMPERLLALELILPGSYKTDEAVRGFHDRLTESLRALPGVESVSSVNCPPSAGDCGDNFYSIPDRPAPAQGDVPVALFNMADGGYFRTMGIPVVAGREFTEADRRDAPRVAIVNQTFARRWWPGESAVGREIKVGGPYRDGETLQIIGVVGDVSQMGLDTEPVEETFRPFPQAPSWAMVMMIRTSGDPGALSAAVRHTVHQADGKLPIQSLQVFEKTLANTLDRRRFSTLLLALFAGLAMTLAAVGIYGLLAYWVSMREKDIAIRMALGARRSIILRDVSLQALQLAVLGIAVGALSAWIASRWVAALVFGISAQSPVTMAGAAFVVGVLAGLASAVPAWRATRVDPLSKLRES